MVYGMVRGRRVARNYVGGVVVNFCGIRSGLMCGGIRKRENSWLWWHGYMLWLATKMME